MFRILVFNVVHKPLFCIKSVYCVHVDELDNLISLC